YTLDGPDHIKSVWLIRRIRVVFLFKKDFASQIVRAGKCICLVNLFFVQAYACDLTVSLLRQPYRRTSDSTTGVQTCLAAVDPCAISKHLIDIPKSLAKIFY